MEKIWNEVRNFAIHGGGAFLVVGWWLCSVLPRISSTVGKFERSGYLSRTTQNLWSTSSFLIFCPFMTACTACSIVLGISLP